VTPQSQIVNDFTANHKKAWESILVTRPTPRGSGIAQLVGDEQRRSPRDMQIPCG